MAEDFNTRTGLSEDRFAELVRFCNASDNRQDNLNRARVLGLGEPGVQVAPGAIIRLSGDGHIGRDVFIGLYCYVNGNVRIGERTLVGPHCSIAASNHEFNVQTQDFTGPRRDQKQFIVIGEGCWLASGAMVTAGVTIGRCVLVCANAVVTRDVGDYAIVAGTPARQVGRIDPQTGAYSWFDRED